NAFFADVAKVAKAQHAAFSPDKVNYGAYGDSGHHLHFHLVPKYKDEFEWNAPFAMNPEKQLYQMKNTKHLLKRFAAI
ncbi:HIT family protein, partial [Jeotgalibaca porci]|uniref:HIT family protein n=1 Tax=Jeotgalibaca porci TaxID=1868793 RepID=UPI0035A18692